MAESNFFGEMKGKVALITGSSAGIGEATALEFAKLGVSVCLHGRDENRLQQVKQKCIQLGLKEEQVHSVTGDIMVEENVRNVAKAVIDHFSTIDILVNNAGGCYYENVMETTWQQMDSMFQQHVKTPLLLVQLLQEHLIKNKGAIVTVSSAAKHIPMNGIMVPYSLAKAAETHLNAILNIELAPKGVRCNAVSPAYTLTRITVNSGLTKTVEEGHDMYKEGAKKSLQGRAADPVEMARTIVFLASHAAPYIVGQDLLVDGGLEANRVVLH